MAFEEILTTSAVSVGLFAAAIWLGRTWIVARLTADIRLDNDSKLEELRSQLQRANSTLSDITSAGHIAYSQSQITILPRKIKAIETVWNSVLAWNEMSAASMFVAVLPIDWVQKYGSNPSTKSNFEILLKNPEHLAFLKKQNDTELDRPFISERGWALYAAYSGFYMSRITKASMFLFPSMNHAEIWKHVNERQLIEASAPADILNLYDANVLEGTNAFLKYLKDEMIDEFRAEISGTRDSKSAVSNAAVILDAAERLVKSSTEKPENPLDKPLVQPN
ncbi:MAG TPA: hypothetical protein VGK14_08455 [Novimethylophilus sp.]|jgi:hypothetical protein|uniref:hypothetical protein n=1 Tax=Novimethylophilus sp. TaxID=2137426 RepID=UPI002F42EA0C